MNNFELSSETTQELLSSALRARDKAHAPYSKFAVGAAVLTENGEIFTGCNIENASYGATVCAERVAIFKAISAGHKSIKAIAVIADLPEPISPCGICRQVISEFGLDAIVVMANTKGKTNTSSMTELFPHAFKFSNGDKNK
jgi:cytidine deaminase